MSKSKLSKIYIMTPLALLCCFLWGSAFPMVKTGYQMFSIGESDTASQILFAGMRFALAGILVIIFGSIIAKNRFIRKIKRDRPLSCAKCVSDYIAVHSVLYRTCAHKRRKVKRSCGAQCFSFSNFISSCF